LEQYFITPTSYSIHRKGENPVFGENIHVKLEDEAGGFFILLESDGKEIRCDLDELELVYNTAKKLIDEAEGNK